MNANFDISGKRFGRLLVVRQAEWHTVPNGSRMSVWACVCDCGTELNVRKPYLTSGDTSSCGCLRRESAAALKLSHGLSNKSSTYDIWVLMRQRCNNPKASGYRYYGGAGVQVAARWDSFDNFLADMGERPDGLTLERKDPHGNYEPGNCEWATWIQQSKNKRRHAQQQAAKAFT